MVFGKNLNISVSAKSDTTGKGISRGAEWRKFQLRSTFQRGVMGVERIRSCELHTLTLKLRRILYGKDFRIMSFLFVDQIHKL